MRFLRALPQSATRNRLAGVVSLDYGSRRLSQVRVHLRSEKYARDLVTDSEGLYEVYDLPASTYRVSIDTPEGLRILFPIVADGDMRRNIFSDLEAKSVEIRFDLSTTADISFLLVEDNQISGRVLDSNGNPLKDICVHLVPAGSDPSSATSRSRVFDCSEPGGSYVLKDMPAGRYELVADRNQRFVYYPGTLERTGSAIVSIGTGERKTGFDIRIPY